MSEHPEEPVGEGQQDTKHFYDRIWPLIWVRKESFWEDVTSRGLAAGIVALIGVLAANAAGLFGDGNGNTQAQIYYTLLNVVVDLRVILVGLLVILIFAERFIHQLTRPASRLSPAAKRFAKVVVWVVAALFAIILLMRVEDLRHSIPFIRNLMN
jgi:hypothetical protein